MVDRPIIFSSPMVRALLGGRKTQTRRLATSPLRRVVVGDRLYVREHWRVSSAQNGVAPRDLPRDLTVELIADGNGALLGKHRQGMHMPRWASRLTLIVEGVKVEPLQAISEADAEAEGVVWDSADGFDVWYVPGADIPHTATAAECFNGLWSSLHTKEGERWQDNPDVVALTLRVEHGNIDRIAA